MLGYECQSLNYSLLKHSDSLVVVSGAIVGAQVSPSDRLSHGRIYQFYHSQYGCFH